MRKAPYVVLLLALFAGVGFVLARRPASPLSASLAAQAAPADDAGFTRAEPPASLSFPADDGPHDDYQTEWWYFTGNLTAETGEHFGYQLTFFRRALQPADERADRDTAWATEQVYLAHFALTDVAGRDHYAFERLGRGAAGLAGAQAEPFRVWLDDWSVTSTEDGTLSDVGAPVRLRANAGDVVARPGVAQCEAAGVAGRERLQPERPRPRQCVILLFIDADGRGGAGDVRR